MSQTAGPTRHKPAQRNRKLESRNPTLTNDQHRQTDRPPRRHDAPATLPPMPRVAWLG